MEELQNLEMGEFGVSAPTYWQEEGAYHSEDARRCGRCGHCFRCGSCFRCFGCFGCFGCFHLFW